MFFQSLKSLLEMCLFLFHPCQLPPRVVPSAHALRYEVIGSRVVQILQYNFKLFGIQSELHVLPFINDFDIPPGLETPFIETSAPTCSVRGVVRVALSSVVLNNCISAPPWVRW